MDASFEALNVFIFLIPGFVASLLLNSIVVRKEKDTFAKIVEALVFSLITYTCVTAFSGESPVFLIETQADNTKTYSITFNRSFVIPLVVLSILFPLFIGLLTTTNIHMRILRRLKITDKTARETVWLDGFTEQKRYVIVNLSDGRRIFGWPMYYSDQQDDGLLYLYDPSWIGDDGYVELEIHEIFLVKKGNIDSIEFTWLDKKTAKQKKKSQGEN